MKKVAVLGAGGKMGYRVSANLKGAPYQVSHIEVSEAGRTRLKELGIACVEADKALPEADVVILAIPDNMIEKVTAKLVDKFKLGATLIALDAAAPFAGHLPERKDLTIFVAHPCHPSIFNDETDLEAKRDYFGGLKAKQAIVCALLRGDEANFELAEDVAKRMYAPVIRSHRASGENAPRPRRQNALAFRSGPRRVAASQSRTAAARRVVERQFVEPAALAAYAALLPGRAGGRRGSASRSRPGAIGQPLKVSSLNPPPLTQSGLRSTWAVAAGLLTAAAACSKPSLRDGSSGILCAPPTSRRRE